jgi:DNA-binding response OmpR family regulator
MTLNLMIVEDDETMRNLLKILLEMEGFSVTLCEKLDEPGILRNIKEVSPDILLMDLRIKNVDGLSILKNLRLDDITKKLKILMTSGMPEAEKCLKAGANAFLLKPFMPDELISSIRNLGA